jgi:hypothetical protein
MTQWHNPTRCLSRTYFAFLALCPDTVGLLLVGAVPVGRRRHGGVKQHGTWLACLVLTVWAGRHVAAVTLPPTKSDGPHPDKTCPGRPSLMAITLWSLWRRCGEAAWWLTLPPIRLRSRNREPATYLRSIISYQIDGWGARASASRHLPLPPASGEARGRGMGKV